MTLKLSEFGNRCLMLGHGNGSGVSGIICGSRAATARAFPRVDDWLAPRVSRECNLFGHEENRLIVDHLVPPQISSILTIALTLTCEVFDFARHLSLVAGHCLLGPGGVPEEPVLFLILLLQEPLSVSPEFVWLLTKP